MATTVDKSSANRNNYLAQLYAAIRAQKPRKFLEYIVNKQENVDCPIAASDFLTKYRPELIDSTALHWAYEQSNHDAFDLLLAHRADYNRQHSKNTSVLRRVIEASFNEEEARKLGRRFEEYECHPSVDEANGFVVMQQRFIDNFTKYRDNWRLWGAFDGNKYINSILASCLRNRHFPDGSSNDGISTFHVACLTNNIEAIEFFLKNNVDLRESASTFYGFTPLHFAVRYCNVKVMKTLLTSNGAANLSVIRDTESMTPLDMLLDQNLKIIEWLQAKNKLPYRVAIVDYLDNEEKMKAIMTHSSDFSCFHAACSTRNEVTLQQFLIANWQAQDRAKEISSQLWSGYTALHFAAFFNIMNNVKDLMSVGADIERKNANGLTPLDLLATRATLDDLHFVVSHHKESWRFIRLSDDKTKLLDLILAMKSASDFQTFLAQVHVDTFIPLDSPLWPGCTILHLAVTFSETSRKLRFLNDIVHSNRNHLYDTEYDECCREHELSYLKRIQICLDNKANVNRKDARGWTAINLAFRQRQIEACKLMLREDCIANFRDDDNLSHLHVACFAKDRNSMEMLIANGADVNLAIKSSFKWQCDYYDCTSTDMFNISGSTPLHLAVSQGDLDTVKELLRKGANVSVKDSQGMSPLHRVFIVEQMWRSVTEFLLDKTKASVMRFILRRGEPMGITTSTKATLIAFDMYKELLSSLSLQESIVDEVGLSHLHIALFANNMAAVEELLNHGANINLAIDCTRKKFDAGHPLSLLSHYDGYTPFHIARCHPHSKRILRERCGVDVFTRALNGKTPIFDMGRETFDSFVNELKTNEALRTRFQDIFGWTLLHVACELVDVQLLEFTLKIRVDVNARTHDDSPKYPGCTALQIIIFRCDGALNHRNVQKVNLILTVLLAQGADVMLTDVHGNTPMHISNIPDFNFFSSTTRKSCEGSDFTNVLLQHVKDFAINPTNRQGISVFHIVCARHELVAVEKFLNCGGVDVNGPIDFFSSKTQLAGCTPLHIALRHHGDPYEQLHVVEMLLKYGADVRAVDAAGDTPLHVAVECNVFNRRPLLKKICEYGADVNATNVHGKTPLEVMLSINPQMYSRDEVEFFLERGCRMNAFNPITQVGYISLICCDETIVSSAKYEMLRAALEKNGPINAHVDEMGRSVIHNIVSIPSYPVANDLGTIDYLMSFNCDIDQQDESGKTALHLAVQFRNAAAIKALLTYEADVNVVDSSGKTAFAYSLEDETLCDPIDVGHHDHHLAIQFLARYFYHLTIRNLRVNDINRQLIRAYYNEYRRERQGVEQSYAKLMDVKIGDTAYTLADFLSETGAIAFYSMIKPRDRDVISQFFTTTIKEQSFNKWNFLCKLQYRKALQRAELVENARDAFNTAIGFLAPYEYFEMIEKFLANEDLKSLIVAMASRRH